MTPTIEATQNSLKLSYLRFISDSAPGLLLVLGILVLDRNGQLPIPIIPRDDTLKTLVAVVVFLLVTPIGLMINGVSHFLLGGLQHWIAGRCITSAVWPIANTHDILRVKLWRPYFGVNGNWPQIAYEIDDLLETYLPHLAAVLDHVRALKKFFRSFGLLAAAAISAAAGWAGAIAAGLLLLALVVALFLREKKYQWGNGILVVVAAGFATCGCGRERIVAAVCLFAIAVAAVLFAGFIEFYQYGSMMLFLYQLFVRNDVPRFELSAETVRDRLQIMTARTDAKAALTATPGAAAAPA